MASYDVREKVWNPPMPLLFQRSIGGENRAFTPTAIRKLLINALAVTNLTDTNGDPLVFSPHDFRRIFVTDAIMSGLPPHITQLICGHKNIDTTMGYNNPQELHQTGEKPQVTRSAWWRSGASKLVCGSCLTRSDPKAIPSDARYDHKRE